MSRATGYVFMDGKPAGFFIYDGTSDLAYPFIVGSSDEAWQHYQQNRPWADHPEDCRESETATLYTDYGGGFWWRGQVCLTHGYIWPGPGTDPWDQFEKGWWMPKVPVDGKPPEMADRGSERDDG